jgi:hypothetical protein
VGEAVVKCAPDQDLYLIWSSQIDNAIVAGDREGIIEHLLANEPQTPGHTAEERLARADEHGTSMLDCRWYGWNDEYFRVMEHAPPRPAGPAGDWHIRRDRLADYAEALLAEDEAAGWALMEWQLWE